MKKGYWIKTLLVAFAAGCVGPFYFGFLGDKPSEAVLQTSFWLPFGLVVAVQWMRRLYL